MLLGFAAVAEIATGVALLIIPRLVGRLLLGVELPGDGVAVARVAGAGILSLGLACWPGKEPRQTAFCAMTTYGLIIGLYLVYLAVRRGYSGPLLWPAAIYHLLLTALFASRYFKRQEPPSPQPK